MRSAEGGEDRASKAQDEDRKTKAAWGIKRLRSPYLSLLALPQSVPPGDRAQAAAILARVESTLDIRMRWTPEERGRLRVMRAKWARRAAGDDTLFNIRGWQADPVRKGRGEWERHQQDLEFSKAMDEVRKVIDK